MFQASKLMGACVFGCVLGAVSLAPLDSADAFLTLYHFRGVGLRAPDGEYPNTRMDGEYPNTRMIIDGAGNLFGTTLLGGSSAAGAVFQLTKRDGFKKRRLYSFPAGGADGAYPEAGVIAGALPGTLDGTTSGGGDSTNCTGGCGTVFQLSRQPGDGWTQTKLYSFQGSNELKPDGAYPAGGLVRDQAGNIYGTTQSGGTGSCVNVNGCGTVFRLAPDGTETLRLSFQGGSGDGSQPTGVLVMDPAGVLYGTTVSGGGTGCGGAGCGTVFRLAPDGTETVLHSFCSLSLITCADVDGASPYGGVVMYKGNLYGTTSAGGRAGCGGSGCGTVFEITAAGSERVLYSFCGKQNCSDGSVPYSSLVLDHKGNIYGTTFSGGLCAFCGTVFKLAPGGTGYAQLSSFCGTGRGNCIGGNEPYAGLTLQGRFLYGAATSGGYHRNCAGGCGTVFKLELE